MSLRPGAVVPGLVVRDRAADDATAADGSGRAGRAAGSGCARPRSQIAPPALLTRADEPRITVTWDRASIADVVAGFASFSGRTIIMGKDVKGEVTAEIKNQPWPQAFQAILATQGLSAQEMSGGIIRVDAPATLAALDSLEPLETSLVRINYAQAGSLSKTVESILTKGRGRVVADTASNSLILTEPAAASPASRTSCAASTCARRSSRSRPRSSSSIAPTSSSSASSTTWATATSSSTS